VAGKAEIFKSCFILFSLGGLFAPDPTHGMMFTPAPSAAEKSKAILRRTSQAL
jgi:hypothetical protein